MEKSFDFAIIEERQQLENRLKKQGYIRNYKAFANLRPGEYTISEHGSEYSFEGPRKFALRYMEK